MEVDFMQCIQLLQILLQIYCHPALSLKVSSKQQKISVKKLSAAHKTLWSQGDGTLINNYNYYYAQPAHF